MATQVRNRNDFSPPRRQGRANGTPSEPRGSSVEQRKTILAILLMAVAILVFLALVSYDADDERKVKLFLDAPSTILGGGGTAADKPDTPNNWLAAVGAIVAHFFIKSTFGYVTLALPILVLLWGWTMLRKEGYGRAITITNYTIVTALLISASFGMIRLIFPEGGPSIEWSGEDGFWVSLKLSQIVGRAGGSVVLFVSILITAVLAVDLDVHQTVERLRTLALQLADWFGRKMDAWQERRLARGEEEPAVRVQKPGIRQPADDAEPGDDEADTAPAIERPAPTINRAEVRKSPPVLLVKPAPVQAPKDSEDMTPAAGDLAYVPPSVDLLTLPVPGKEDVDEDELKANADLLRETLAQFDVELESVSVTPGPVVTLYELVPASGVKISRIVSLENDMALKLAAKGIRIMAPIPGKSAVGVEIPNSHRSLVTIRSVIDSDDFRDTSANLPLAMGKTISGEVFADDLAKMPHLLIAGSTGSGKSVGINTILASLLFRLHPSDLKLVIIDPKKIELAQYGKLKNHFLAVSPDVDEEIITTPRNAVMALKGVEYEMERRYDRLAAAGVRNIVDYNDRMKNGKLKDTEEVRHAKMPYLIVVIDELADLMITAAREVEEPIARLAQLARAVGIHLIVATQRPSVDVITGVIKANFPARIAYQVASKTDSRTILDMNGAEQLLGNGDMLYLASGTPKPIRLQNAYISPDEVDAIVDHIAGQAGFAAPFTLPSIMEKKRSADGTGGEGRDELFQEAARLIVRHQQGSVSLLQRRLKVGYSRAARLVDELEAAGIVGPFDGSKAREVLVESEAELDVILNS